MTSTISGTTTAPLPVLFSLNLHGRIGRELDKEPASKLKDERARQLAIKRKAKHEVELLSLEWSKIMLEREISAALDPATDPALAHKIRQALINRGIGKVREAEDENADAKKKVGDVDTLLEVLAAFSTAAGAAQAHGVAHTPRIERDIGSGGTDEDSLQSFLDDLDNDEGEDDAQ